MRLLAFSDLHDSPPRAAALVEAGAGADLVIGAGDFCNARRGLADAMAPFAALAAPFVLEPGNAESAGELAAAAPPGATVLHGTGTTVGGLVLFGLGHAVPPTPFGAWSCDLTEDRAAALLDACTGCDILVTHAPPKGVADRSRTGESLGSTAIRDAILRLQPRLALCGHIHDSWGAEGRIGATRVVNLGPGGTWFEL